MLYTQQQIKDLQTDHIRNIRDSEIQQKLIAAGRYTITDSCHISSVHALQPCIYGVLIEKLLRNKVLGGVKPPNGTFGDALVGDVGIEIKVSFSQSKNEFGLRQIRMHDNTKYYLLLNYDRYGGPKIPKNVTAFIDFDDDDDDDSKPYGGIYFFLVPKKAMQDLILEYGGYTHGTKETHGKIEDLDNYEGKEFSLTYNKYGKEDSISRKIWDELQEYGQTEQYIKDFFDDIRKKYNMSNTEFGIF